MEVDLCDLLLNMKLREPVRWPVLEPVSLFDISRRQASTELDVNLSLAAANDSNMPEAQTYLVSSTDWLP